MIRCRSRFGPPNRQSRCSHAPVHDRPDRPLRSWNHARASDAEGCRTILGASGLDRTDEPTDVDVPHPVTRSRSSWVSRLLAIPTGFDVSCLLWASKASLTKAILTARVCHSFAGSSCSMNSSRMRLGAAIKAILRLPNVPSTKAGPHKTSCPSNWRSRLSVNSAT
jgi:hypothetical protein